MQKYIVLLLLLITSCGKFNYSPYMSNTKNLNHNANALIEISNRASQFTNSYKIAIIADTHDYYKELDEAVDHINDKKNEYAFVVVLGDLTNIGLISEFETNKKFLDRLQLPYVTIIGNHDLLTNGASIYQQMYGKDNYSFTFKQTKFILYNNNNWESSYLVPDTDWVTNELTSSASTHNILMAHVSVADTARFTQNEIDTYENLINANNVRYTFNGHDHNFAESVFGTSTRITAGSSSKKVFVELSITDGGVSHEFINF